MKRTNKYNLRLAKIETVKNDDFQAKSLELEFENHDEIFHIINLIKEKNHFDDDNQSIEFAIGLKLLTEVILKNRKNDLFTDLAHEIKRFMSKLKNS